MGAAIVEDMLWGSFFLCQLLKRSFDLSRFLEKYPTRFRSEIDQGVRRTLGERGREVEKERRVGKKRERERGGAT